MMGVAFHVERIYCFYYLVEYFKGLMLCEWHPIWNVFVESALISFNLIHETNIGFIFLLDVEEILRKVKAIYLLVHDHLVNVESILKIMILDSLNDEGFVKIIEWIDFMKIWFVNGVEITTSEFFTKFRNHLTQNVILQW